MAIPSIALIPSGYKANKVYSVLPTDGAGDLTFTRASSATRVNKEGLLETVATGVPRLDYSAGGCPSLLLEPQSTNLLLRSEEFNDASWTRLNSTITDNSVIALDGTLTADKSILNVGVNPLAPDGTGVSQNQTVTSGVYTYSIFAKAGERNIIRFRDGGSTGGYLVVNLSNGTFTNAAPSRFVNPQVISYTNGWYRIIFTTATITNPNVYPLRFGDTGETGDGFSGGFIWGAQLEAGSYATSYIPTAGAISTRIEDTANGAGDASTFNDSEGVLFAEISALADDLTNRAISLSDGTADNGIQIFYYNVSNRIRCRVYSGGVLQDTINIIGYTITDTHKIALKWGSGFMSVFIDGVINDAALAITSTPVGLDRLNLDLGQGSSDFYGKVKGLQVFTTALTDAELITLTTL